jgi:hypothetical protein
MAGLLGSMTYIAHGTGHALDVLVPITGPLPRRDDRSLPIRQPAAGMNRSARPDGFNAAGFAALPEHPAINATLAGISATHRLMASGSHARKTILDVAEPAGR